MSKSIAEIQQEFFSILPKVFTNKQAQNTANEMQEAYGFSDTSKYRILRKSKHLNIKWNERPTLSLFSEPEQKITELDILSVLLEHKKNSFLSHYSALYYNGLVEQRPKEFYISSAMKENFNNSSAELNELRVLQAFMKEPRITSNYFTYEGNKYNLLEREKKTYIGIVERKFHFEHIIIIFKITDTERSFLDCIISPQYSGGLLTVIASFAEVDLDLKKLYDYYAAIKPAYPYWQSIGFLLEKLYSEDLANNWEAFFKSQEKKDFFLAHNYKTTWEVSSRWKVSYPRGLFRK